MRTIKVKTSGAGWKSAFAFFVVSIFAALLVGFGIPASAATTSSLSAKVYNEYYAGTELRPMDDPSLADAYNVCETTSVSNINQTTLEDIFRACGNTNILIHYTGFLKSPTAQTLQFGGASDDGIWGTIGGVKVFDNWVVQGCATSTTGRGVTFAAGESKPVDIWYFQAGWGYCNELDISTDGTNFSPVNSSWLSETNPVPTRFTDTVIDTQTNLGSNYNSNVAATGSAPVTYSIASGALPPGISLNQDTGVISGTSTNSGAYTFSITATAADAAANTDTTQNLTISVGTSVSLTTGLRSQTVWINQAFSARAVFGGFPTPTVALARNSGALPPGLTLAADGTISGTPTTAGSYTFNLTGRNFVGSATTANYTYTVEGTPAYTAGDDFSANINLGDAYSKTPTVTGSSLTYSLDGTVPRGITLDSRTGKLAGTATQAGSFTFRVKAHNAGGDVYSQSSTLVINRAPAFTNASVASHIRKDTSDYSFTFQTNGFPLAVYAVTSGSLPRGMTLSSTGVLSGTPNTKGTYNFTVEARNAIGASSISKTIDINQAPTPVDVSLLQAILAGTTYSDAITYEGWPNPSYAISEGALPPGLSLNALSGAITGASDLGGQYTFRFKVTAGTDSVLTDTYSLIVNQEPRKFDDSIADTTGVGAVYDDGVSATGFPEPTYSLKSGVLPAGLNLDPYTGNITGTPTTPGNYAFTITATNTYGTLDFPLSINAQQAPAFINPDFPATFNFGDTVSTKFTATGFPSAVYSVSAGSLPDGLTLDPVSGMVSGVITNGGNFNFTISATNSLGNAATQSFNVMVAGETAKIDVVANIGDVVTDKSIDISSDGLKPKANYQVLLHSTPQIIGQGKTDAKGSVKTAAKLPGGLDPGWHTITLKSLNSDGTAFESSVYFQITDTLMLEEVTDQAPTPAQKAEALTNDPEFYKRMGIDPAGTVTPAAAAAQVQQVASVVSSVALVSAAAAGAAAAASAAASAGGAASAAAGGASSSAGAARAGGSAPSSSSSSSSSGGGARTSGGGSSSGGGGGSSSGNSSSGSDGGDGGGADYGSLEADHDDFETEGVGFWDRLPFWKLKWLTATDVPLTNLIESSARFSPVVSRIFNDGSYIRALIGSLSGIGYLAALVIGVAAVDPHASSLATSGRVGALVLLMALGTLDALIGLIGMAAFAATSLLIHPIAGVGDFRYLLAMFILGFAPSIMSTTFRKIRRPAIENLNDAYERLIDLALIGFISVLTVMSLVGSVSAFAGATVPLSKDVKPIAFAIAAVALSRVVLEEVAAKLAPERLNRINPTEVPGTFTWQPWASLVLKFAVLITMIGGMVGMGWHLWVGAFLIFLPGIIGMVFPNLPSFKWIHEFIPGGVGALAFATLISSWSGSLVNLLLGKSPLYGQLSFILIPLPVILISIVGMFGQSEDKLWQRLNKKWIYIAGGIAVFLFTVQVTNFIPTIFG